MTGKNPDVNKGHRQRLREKFIRAGEPAFLDYEILELLLSYGIARQDVKPLAKDLLKKFRSLGNVFDASMEELTAMDGIGEHTAVLIKLMRTLMNRYLKQELAQEDFMTNSDVFCDYARTRLGEYKNEVMMIFFLNTQNMLIDVEIMNEGSTDCVVIFPSVVAKKALMRSAKSIVLCHNHPSGIVTPSREDNLVTRNVRAALAPLKILLLDHLIVSRYDYYSYRFADNKKPPAFRMLSPLTDDTADIQWRGDHAADS